jgi:hypothetical protein
MNGKYEVEEIEHCRYRVKKKSKNTSYLVDLLKNNGNGYCDCQDFQINRIPLYNSGYRGPNTKCKHIMIARWYFFQSIADEIFEQIARREKASVE